ncbi:Vitamin B12-binding protein [bioreactor metagenome]|jgi:ABC-type Fe3+-hydroxamate transport system, periplasmic component|uniref:ABC-type Fe3+-hydroxamate transport system n=2 Tax=root TaxID=1 RepID=A0AB33HV78_9CHLR|nr:MULTISPECIES: helical backbone metal receptor [Dehalococcoides]MBF4481772.1 ABC transporter substrate-binding protein [Dehalococcoides mccartyi]MBJ7531530.1 ABC transporter substrate-binding protein [Dehalococcoides mccartyi]MEA4878826.1 helical backbone metal receptor [Dehalococcoides mccartyi]POZ59916.1 Vitamin B12 ABC transporter, B12-binding component BtuF [Dehalococcoides mccartyi]BAZ97947.1 ABC-type Fe3+-hydroxamate transport system [Dehalococcoides mccartyi]
MIKEYQIYNETRLPAKRIVSLAPSFTQTLFFLGLEDRIVGCTENCLQNHDLKNVLTVGRFASPDLAGIRELNPDLILGLDRVHSEALTVLKQSKAGIFVQRIQTVFGIIGAIEAINKLAGNSREGAARVRKLRKRLQRVCSRLQGVKPVRVYRMLSTEPLVTPSAACYQYDAIRLAGGEQMQLDFADPYTPVSPADVFAFDPEFIVSCGQGENQPAKPRCQGCKKEKPICMRTPADIINADGWNGTTAARNGQVYTIGCESLCYPGPGLIDGIEMMAGLFHPDLQAGIAAEEDAQEEQTVQIKI